MQLQSALGTAHLATGCGRSAGARIFALTPARARPSIRAFLAQRAATAAARPASIMLWRSLLSCRLAARRGRARGRGARRRHARRGGARVLRGATWYKLAPGIALEDGDIVSAGPKAQVQLESPAGTIGNLAGEATLLVTVAKGGAPRADAGRPAALKVAAKAPGVRVRTAAFEAEIADGIVGHARGRRCRRSLRRGGQRKARRMRAGTPRDAKRGEYWRKSGNAPFTSQPLAPKAFVDALPRNFLDPLPALAARIKSKPRARRRPRDHLRRSRAVACRPRPRGVREALREPLARSRRSARRSSRIVARYPSWDRMLHPEKYAPKPAPAKQHAKEANMKLIWKFNLVLLGIFALGFVVAGYISYQALQANAREEILQNARLHDGSGAVDAQLHRRAGQAAARYADASTSSCRRRCPRSPRPSSSTSCARSTRTTRYKEATLNPTNPRDRAADWEADVVNMFRDDVDHDRDRRRARHADGPLAVSRRGRSRSRAPRASSATARSRPRPRR